MCLLNNVFVSIKKLTFHTGYEILCKVPMGGLPLSPLRLPRHIVQKEGINQKDIGKNPKKLYLQPFQILKWRKVYGGHI